MRAERFRAAGRSNPGPHFRFVVSGPHRRGGVRHTRWTAFRSWTGQNRDERGVKERDTIIERYWPLVVRMSFALALANLLAAILVAMGGAGFIRSSRTRWRGCSSR